MNREELSGQLLQSMYDKTFIDLYDHIAGTWPADPEIFGCAKALGDQLVEEKLARYIDQQHTQLTITNYGRYWIMKGGYSEYLHSGERRTKEHHERHDHDHQANEHHHSESEKKLRDALAEAKLKFTKFRIVTFWWSFSVSLVGFFLSLLSIYLVMQKR